MANVPECPYCHAHNECFTGMRKGLGAPGKGDVSICLGCSGVALFTGVGIEVRKPTMEEKHVLFCDPSVQNGIRIVNHLRRHHRPD